MQRTPEKLVFERADCDALCHILSIYLKTQGDQLAEDEATVLYSVWERASDLALMEDGDSRKALARGVFAPTKRPKVIDKGQATVETSEFALLGRAIGWAGINLAQGTSTFQKITSELLDVGYENPEIQEVFEEADRAFATEYYPQLLIAAGDIARTWSVQLTE